MGSFESLLGRNGFLPHGYCFQWSPELLWTMVSSDALIALAYFSIPLTILRFVRQRPVSQYLGVPILFSAFIFACGVTHLMDIWTIWRPDYALQTLTKTATAAISVVTAVILWRLLPRMVKIPLTAELQQAVGNLEQEVARRRSVEDHLLDVEQSLAVTLSSVGAGFIATDAQGLVTRLNVVAEEVTGWNGTHAIGRSVWEVFDREGRTDEMRQRNPIDVVIERGQTAQAPQSVICIARDGRLTPVEVHVAVTRNDSGQVRGMSIVFRDTARLSKAESELRRLAAVVESSSDAIIAKDLSGTITDWNRAAQRMFGYSADEAVGQQVQMLVPPEREIEEVHILASLVGGREVPPFRTVRLAKDGHRVEVSVAVSPIRDAFGRVIGGAKVARDLSHQRQIEHALRQSEARLRFAMDSAHLGDWELDPGSGAVHRSLRHDQCFGHGAPLARWSRQTWLEHVHEDDRDAVAQSLDFALRSRSDWHCSFRVRWPDGSLHWLRTDGKPMGERDGPDDRLVGIVGDITAQREAEEARLQAQRLVDENRRMHEIARARSQFLANMSHELRTPLNAVIGFADLLHAGLVPPESPKHTQYLAHISASGHHLLQIINDVLDLSKVDAGKLSFHPADIDLHAVFDEVVGSLSGAAATKRLQLTCGVAPDLRGLRLDPLRLKQILFNYLSNAVKFTPDGGHIALSALPEGPARFRIEVVDSGAGISTEDQARLFVEFQQLDDGYDKRHQGTGLGLALTRRLVEAQGGYVGVRSEPGRGSTFFAVLPREAAEEAFRDDGKVEMLIVEGDDSVRDGLAQGLSREGVDVRTASSIGEVVDLMRRRRYDFVSLGLRLRDGAGLDALRELRAGEQSVATGVRSLTATASGGRAKAFAVADVIAKPPEAVEIETALAPLRPLLAKGGRIMIVDDDPRASELMVAVLAGLGIESLAVSGGAAALTLLSSVRPVGMVLDLMMPEVDGFQVLAALRADPEWRDLPVFVWTAMTLTAAEHALLLRTAQALIEKDGGAISAAVALLLHERMRTSGDAKEGGS